MQPTNPPPPSGSAAQSTQEQAGKPQGRTISDEQATDFSERMKKKGRSEQKQTEGKGEQSLEKLFAERHRSNRENQSDTQSDSDTPAELQKQLQQKKQGEAEGDELRTHHQTGESTVGQSASIHDAAKPQKIETVQSIRSPDEINRIVNKLADSIAVSSKDAINGTEVRITLKENILADTEIRIQKVAGELRVTLSTGSADSHQFLTANETSLQRTLNERFGDKVQVSVNLSGGDNEQHDGRSKQEYIGQENDENDE